MITFRSAYFRKVSAYKSLSDHDCYVMNGVGKPMVGSYTDLRGHPNSYSRADYYHSVIQRADQIDALAKVEGKTTGVIILFSATEKDIALARSKVDFVVCSPKGDRVSIEITFTRPIAGNAQEWISTYIYSDKELWHNTIYASKIKEEKEAEDASVMEIINDYMAEDEATFSSEVETDTLIRTDEGDSHVENTGEG